MGGVDVLQALIKTHAVEMISLVHRKLRLQNYFSYTFDDGQNYLNKSNIL